jgi:hypothetical protein
LWTVPSALPGVLWFRVRRLEDEDVSLLIRLARSYAVRPEAPIGFLIDAAGTGEFPGWARLRAEAAAVPGLLLVATARAEDLMTLGDLSGCATVTVRLDEKAAEVIHSGLVRRGATNVPHWREALTSSDGLTLEFTHLLMRGRRLSELIGEQVRRRIEEARSLELDVMALVSVADQWAATLPTVAVAKSCNASDFELRSAVTRLANEHLLVERDGKMVGLHRLRSRAISEAIHAQPPPDVATTVRRVVQLVSVRELHRFVANAIDEEPLHEEAILNAAVAESGDPRRLAAYLHGLRLADFHEVAKKWKSLAEDHDVPASSQPLLLFFAIAGIAFPDFFPTELRAARDAIEGAPRPTRRDRLVREVRSTTVATLIGSLSDIGAATNIFASLDRCEEEVASAVIGELTSSSALVRTLRNAPIEMLADCLAAARSSHSSIARTLHESLGGEEWMLARLRVHDPWVTQLDVRVDDGALVGHARLLHVSDRAQGDPRERAVAFGRTLLRCLPSIERVDVQALLPGDQDLRIGDYVHGVSGLVRQYDQSTAGVAWNQTRSRAVLTLLGETDTVRLAEALPLLEEASVLAHEFGTALVTGKFMVSADELGTRLAELHERGRSLKPPLGAVELGDTEISEQATVLMSDDVSGLLTDLTGNIFRRLSQSEEYPGLAAYLSETVISVHLDGTIRQPWALIGIDGHPPCLDQLRSTLLDLQAVVRELAHEDVDAARIGRSARAGARAQALRRAADTCRLTTRRRRQSRREALERHLRASGLRATVFTDQDDTVGLTTEIAVGLELGSLFEWPDALSQLVTVLEPDRPLEETYFLIPLRQGRPVPSVCAKLISSALSSPGLDEWEDLLPEAHPVHLTNQVDDAQEALQTLSGISHLDEAQRSHASVLALIDRSWTAFATARDGLAKSEGCSVVEAVIEYLDVIASNVEHELEGTSTKATFAEEIARGAIQGDTDEMRVLMAARYLALEWDIDTEGALELYASL